MERHMWARVDANVSMTAEDTTETVPPYAPCSCSHLVADGVVSGLEASEIIDVLYSVHSMTASTSTFDFG